MWALLMLQGVLWEHRSSVSGAKSPEALPGGEYSLHLGPSALAALHAEPCAPQNLASSSSKSKLLGCTSQRFRALE